MAASSGSRLRRATPLQGCRATVAACLLLAGMLVAPAQAAAAEPRTARRDGPVTLDAASSDVDYRSNTVVFRDIVIAQGTVRVAADQARATGLDFADSTWSFTGAVRINVDGGALRSDEATVKFAANRVASARVRGTPAQFEQARSGSSELARGRAAAIEYDVAAGTVKLLGDAWLSDGRNEIRGQELTYDVRGQRVQSGSRPGQSDRVQITIRPREPGEPTVGPEPGASGAAPAPAPEAAPDAAPGPAAPATPPAALPAAPSRPEPR